MVQPDRLSDQVAHANDRIEGGHRILKNHPDPGAAKLAQTPLGKPDHLHAPEPDGARDPRTCWLKSHDRPDHHGLA